MKDISLWCSLPVPLAFNVIYIVIDHMEVNMALILPGWLSRHMFLRESYSRRGDGLIGEIKHSLMSSLKLSYV